MYLRACKCWFELLIYKRESEGNFIVYSAKLGSICNLCTLYVSMSTINCIRFIGCGHHVHRYLEPEKNRLKKWAAIAAAIWNGRTIRHCTLSKLSDVGSEHFIHFKSYPAHSHLLDDCCNNYNCDTIEIDARRRKRWTKKKNTGPGMGTQATGGTINVHSNLLNF